MHTPLFCLPYNRITSHSTEAANIDDADGTKAASEEGKRTFEGSNRLLLLFLQGNYLRFLLLFPNESIH